jgi:hypothetical protein
VADRDSTFAGTWRRDPNPTTGRSATELRKRANFDQAPAEGMSCAVIAIGLPFSAALYWALYEGGTALIGAIA